MAGKPPIKARPAPKPAGKARPAGRKPGGLFSGKAAVRAP